MRRTIKATALAAALTLVVAVPAAAQGGPNDDAPQGTELRERVMEQSREQLGTALQEGDQLQIRERTQTRTQAHVEDRDGTPAGDCTGDQLRKQLRDQDCAECDGDGPRYEQRMWHRLSWCVQTAI